MHRHRKEITRIFGHSCLMPGQSAAWTTTARALRRAGFGVTGPEVDAALTRDWPGYVDAMLNADPDADPGAVATPLPTLEVLRRPGRRATQAARKQFIQQLSEQQNVLSDWWLRRMVAVQQPVHEKLTLLWHNHFATSARKVRVAAYMAAQNQKLRTLSLGDFRTLAFRMLTDAAMLRWLDGQTSTAKAPNENLAREFMELFALGHGNGYTEDDVRNGARALTGWVIDADGATSLIPRRHDGTAKTLFGLTRNFDAAGFCDAVLAQPKSGEYVAGRLWQQLASDDPPSPRALDRLVSAYGPGRNLRALTRSDPDRQRVHRRGRGAPDKQGQHPGRVAGRRAEGAAGADRHPRAPTTGRRALHALGQRPFYPPSVGGWPRGHCGCPPRAPEPACTPRPVRRRRRPLDCRRCRRQ